MGSDDWIGEEVPNAPTAAEFLQILTDGIVEEGETIVVAKSVITKAGGNAYVPARWPGVSLKKKTHISISLQKPTDDFGERGGQSSRIRNWTAGWALVLDDVYEKAEPPSVEPTAILETKPGSQQWWYVFDQPTTNRFLMEQLIDGVITAGYTDKGAGNVVRWVRLPGSQPEGKKHKARVTRWEPGLLFDPETLGKQLGLEMKSWDHWNGEGSSFDPAALGKEVDDPLLDWMVANDLIYGESGQGWLRTECPRGHEHSNGNTEAYYLPAHANGGGAFECKHGHEDGGAPGQAEFVQWLGEQGAPVPRSADVLTDAAAILRSMGCQLVGDVDEDSGEVVTASFEYAGDVTPRTNLEGLHDYVYMRQDDRYCNRYTGRTMSPSAFNKAMWLQHGMGAFDIEVTKKDPESGKKVKVPKSIKPEQAFIAEEGEYADEIMYRPDVEEHLFDIDGVRYLNSFHFAPLPEAIYDEEACKLLDGHLKDLFPDDWQMLRQALAYMVQKVGDRIMWMPVLVGRQGDGKSTIAGMVRAALGYARHTGYVRSSSLQHRFNKSLVGKAFVVLEELRVITNEGRYDKTSVYDIMKDMLGGESVEAEGKGRDAVDIPYHVTNYVGTSNFIDAMAVPADDRRCYVLATRYYGKTKEEAPKQSPEYFTALRALVGEKAGVEAHGKVRGWLMSVDISDFDPKADAPMTEAKKRMIGMAASSTELNIVEALTEGAPGVWPDLLSTTRLIEVMRDILNVAPPQTRTLASSLERMGWESVGRVRVSSQGRHTVYYNRSLYKGRTGVDGVGEEFKSRFAPETEREAAAVDKIVNFAGRKTPK